MRKNIIIISVSVIAAIGISAAAFAFLPKYFKKSVSVKSKTDKIITSQSSKASSQGEVSKSESSSRSSASNSGGSAAAEKTPQKSTSESEEKTAAENTQNTDTAAEKVTKIYKPAKTASIKISDMTEEMFFDAASGKNLPYRLYIPKNLKQNKKYPIFLFLHGAGERGQDNYTHIKPLKHAFDSSADLLSECIIIAPQCPEWGWWSLYDYEDNDSYNENGWLGAAMRLTGEIKSKYKADGDRVYISGLSMGGIATWELLEKYPSFFAAGVPICGSGNPNGGYILKDIPIWIYHGTDDTTIPFSASQAMYDGIKAAGGNMAELKTLYGVGHNAWDYALADREMFCWMFAQNKSKAFSGDCSYRYTEKIKVVTPEGATLFTDKNITSFSVETSGNSSRIAAALDFSSAEKLRKAYKNSKNKSFSVYYYGELLYKFIPLKAPEYDEFLFAECATDYLNDFIY